MAGSSTLPLTTVLWPHSNYVDFHHLRLWIICLSIRIKTIVVKIIDIHHNLRKSSWKYFLGNWFKQKKLNALNITFFLFYFSHNLWYYYKIDDDFCIFLWMLSGSVSSLFRVTAVVSSLLKKGKFKKNITATKT